VTVPLYPFESRAPRLGSVKPFDGIRGVGVWCVVADLRRKELLESCPSCVPKFCSESGS
jgi:hypothetical protein